MGDPMVDWLKANGIDLDRIVMWPEIQLLPGRAKIEFVYGLEDEPPRTKLLLRKPATRMVEVPTPVPMPAELWETYSRARADEMMGRTLEILGKAGATVLTARPGSSIVFVCSTGFTGEEGEQFLEAATAHLRERLPGVDISIMTGVDTILHRAPQEG